MTTGTGSFFCLYELTELTSAMQLMHTQKQKQRHMSMGAKCTEKSIQEQ
jgi:hypothetical protein